MAGFVPTPGAVRVDVIQTNSGSNLENTLWYYFAGGEPSVTDMQALGEAINGIFQTSFAPLHPGSWSLRGCVVTDQATESSPSVLVPSATTGGTNAADVMPNNVAWCVAFKTAGRGRSSSGRNYFPAVPRDIVFEDTIDPTFADAVLTAYNRLLVPSLDVGAALVVVSHVSGGLARSAGLVEPVTAITYADLTLDSQRRRLNGRGT